MAKSKYILHECAYCRREAKMEYVGEQIANNSGDSGKVWYRCCRCKHSALLDISSISQSKKNRNINKDECTVYSKEKVFSIGEHIYYPEWDDIGKVIRKDKTSNGTHSIVVAFEKLGERRLLENLKIEENEIIENEIL